MRYSSRLVSGLTLGLLFTLLATACGSTATVTPTTQAASQPAVESQPAPGQTNTAPATASSAPAVSATLDTSPLDYAVISAGRVNTATTPIPCQLAGPVIDAFAASRNMPIKQVSGNNCQWSEGRVNSIDLHFRELSDIDVAERRVNHGAYDTVIDENGPGTNAASYLDDNGETERYFFEAGSRAVFIVAETNPPVTPAELRAMADEVAGLVGSAVEHEEIWQASGDFGQDALCSVWDTETLRQMFGASTGVLGAGQGCGWTFEQDGAVHLLELAIDPWDSIEIYTRNGGPTLEIGDSAALLIEDSAFGTAHKVAFRVGDQAFTVIVESPTQGNLAEVLAANLASRLG